MQETLHATLPLLVGWLVDFNGMVGSDFVRPPASPGPQGGHLTVAFDYQATGVRGVGTLPAGEIATPEQQREALRWNGDVAIDFLRVKNSWGTDFAPPKGSAADLAGYHDLHGDYLFGELDYCISSNGDDCVTRAPHPVLLDVVVPSPSFVAVADSCDATRYRDTCFGDAVRSCFDGRLADFDCRASGLVCGYDEEAGGSGCVPEP